MDRDAPHEGAAGTEDSAQGAEVKHQLEFGSSMKHDIEIIFRFSSKIGRQNFLYAVSFCVLLKKKHISACFTVEARANVGFQYRNYRISIRNSGHFPFLLLNNVPTWNLVFEGVCILLYLMCCCLCKGELKYFKTETQQINL